MIDLLNSDPRVTCYSEVFAHDHYGNMPDGGCRDAATWDSYATLRLPQLNRWGRFHLYFEYLDTQIFAPRPQVDAVGFKLMYYQADRGFGIPAYLRQRQVSVIHLIRLNHLDVILSEEAVRVRKYHHAAPGAEVAAVKVRIEPQTLVYRLEERDGMIQSAREECRQLGTPCLELIYEDLLADVSRLDECFQFLGIEATDSLTSSYQKLNPKSHREILANYEEVAEALAPTRFAQLLH